MIVEVHPPEALRVAVHAQNIVTEHLCCDPIAIYARELHGGCWAISKRLVALFQSYTA
jgi:hypothetical protein